MRDAVKKGGSCWLPAEQRWGPIWDLGYRESYHHGAALNTKPCFVLSVIKHYRKQSWIFVLLVDEIFFWKCETLTKFPEVKNIQRGALRRNVAESPSHFRPTSLCRLTDFISGYLSCVPFVERDGYYPGSKFISVHRNQVFSFFFT